MKQVKLAIAATAVIAALMGIGTGVSAQPGPGMGPGGPCMGPGGPGMGPGKGTMDCPRGFRHHMGPGARLDRMTAHLGLSPEQRYKLLPILDEQFKEMKAVHADENLTRAQVRAKMQEIHKKYFEQINKVLTPDQQKKAAEMKELALERWKSQQDARKSQSAPPAK